MNSIAKTTLSSIIGTLRPQHMLVLKVAAVVTMVVDHIGYGLGVEEFRIIGRFAFPAFAYLFVTGYLHTSDRMHYLGRLSLFAAISQVPYILFFDFPAWQLNILFTFALALLILHLAETKRWMWIILLLPLTIIAEYTIYGFAMILIIRLFYRRPFWMILAASFLSLTFSGIFFPAQLWTIAALPLVLLMSKIPGTWRLPRYTFYWFYPVHLTVLLLVF